MWNGSSLSRKSDSGSQSWCVISLDNGTFLHVTTVVVVQMSVIMNRVQSGWAALKFFHQNMFCNTWYLNNIDCLVQLSSTLILRPHLAFNLSMSEPHTCVENGMFSVYTYIYMVHAYSPCMHFYSICAGSNIFVYVATIQVVTSYAEEKMAKKG